MQVLPQLQEERSLEVTPRGSIDYGSQQAAAQNCPRCVALEQPDSAGPFARAATMGAFAWSPRQSLDCTMIKVEASRQTSGVAINDLMPMTNDVKVQNRLLKHSSHSARMSRQDIVNVMESEVSAKTKLRWGLTVGSILAVLCLLMLAANAGLTYAVIKMSRDTQVADGGSLMDRSGEHVVATAATAGVADLLFAHHAPAEAASALLSLRELVVTTDSGTVAAYQVFSASLVPGVQVEFVVAAPADGSWAMRGAGAEGGAADGTAAAASITAGSGVEMMRIVVCDFGVYEIRGGSRGAAASVGGAGSGRRLLGADTGNGASAAGGAGVASIKGTVYDVTTTAGSCGASETCSASRGGVATAGISCPQVPTCGANQQLYAGPCEARAAGTTVLCANCARPKCPASFTAYATAAGWPPNLAVDGYNFLGKPPPPGPGASSPPPPAGAGLNEAGTADVKQSPPPPRPSPKPAAPSPKPAMPKQAAGATRPPPAKPAAAAKKPPPPTPALKKSPPPRVLKRRGPV